MADTEDEQLFKLDGASDSFIDLSEKSVPKTDGSAKARPIVEDSPASPIITPVFNEQEADILIGLGDETISADRALFDDLLRQRIAKVNRVAADVSKQLDAIKKPS